MPSQPDQTDPLGVASIIYEDHAILAIRVQRLLEARALVLTPMPRTTHLVSNIEVLEGEADDFTVGAAFICVEHQGERQRIYAGRQTPSLARRRRLVSHHAEARGACSIATACIRRWRSRCEPSDCAVVQVKRDSVRNAILDSARDLFSERGYHGTTLLDIAEVAGTGVSSLYSYFPSKIHLLYAVVEPWYKDGFERLEAASRRSTDPRERLRCILLGIWRDMPTENIGLANSHMEALVSADPEQKKPAPLLRWTEERLMRHAEERDPGRPRGADRL